MSADNRPVQNPESENIPSEVRLKVVGIFLTAALLTFSRRNFYEGFNNLGRAIDSVILYAESVGPEKYNQVAIFIQHFSKYL